MSNLLQAIGTNEQRSELLNLINNPFSKSCIDDITMRAYKNWSGGIEIYAKVSFKNGNTSGEQRLEAKTLPELMMKVYEFCNSL